MCPQFIEPQGLSIRDGALMTEQNDWNQAWLYPVQPTDKLISFIATGEANLGSDPNSAQQRVTHHHRIFEFRFPDPYAYFITNIVSTSV